MSDGESRRGAVSDAIRAQRLVAIIRTSSAQEAREAARVLLSCGVGLIEVALTTPDALEVVRELVDVVPDDVHLGVGTAITVDDVRASARAGASFVVSPSTDPAMIRAAHDADLFALPGATTPTEIVAAVAAGADMVKLFPASLWGVRSFRHLRGPLPHVEFVPSGGVAIDDVPKWLAAGAVAVGVGSALTAGTEQDVCDRVTRLRSREG